MHYRAFRLPQKPACSGAASMFALVTGIRPNVFQNCAWLLESKTRLIELICQNFLELSSDKCHDVAPSKPVGVVRSRSGFGRRSHRDEFQCGPGPKTQGQGKPIEILTYGSGVGEEGGRQRPLPHNGSAWVYRVRSELQTANRILRAVGVL